ncbi:MAG: LysR family transcriptional regulator [Polyangiaceae bacterium]
MDTPIDLNLVRYFVAIAELGSFSAAAKRMGVPRSTVSRAVSALEETLGVTLFLRTTRKVTTTQEGLMLLDRISPNLIGLEAALREVPKRGSTPTGTLRITTTADVATTLLAEVLTRYCARYPEVDIDLHLTNAIVDIEKEGYDVGIRVLRTLSGSNLVAKKIADITFQLFASPHYLARRGTPKSPEDLRGHDLVSFRNAPPLDPMWSDVRTKVGRPPRVICDDMFFTQAALRAGLGLGGLPTFIGANDVAEGTLVRVLPKWMATSGSMYLVTPGRRHVPARVRAFRELLTSMLNQQPIPRAEPSLDIQ